MNSLQQSLGRRVAPRRALAPSCVLSLVRLTINDTYKAFRDSGAAHILAVSGVHMGIMGAWALQGIDLR